MRNNLSISAVSLFVFFAFQIQFVNSGAAPPDDMEPPPEDGFCSTLLLAGQTIPAGDVEIVFNEDSTITVTYIADNDFCITEVHFHAACTVEDFPQTKKGNPKNGHFDVNIEDGECETEREFTIDNPQCSLDEEIHFAAHAVVERISFDQEETAWGEGFDFSGKNWAMYFICVDDSELE